MPIFEPIPYEDGMLETRMYKVITQLEDPNGDLLASVTVLVGKEHAMMMLEELAEEDERRQG